MCEAKRPYKHVSEGQVETVERHTFTVQTSNFDFLIYNSTHHIQCAHSYTETFYI